MHNMRKLPIPFSYAFCDDDVDKEMKRVKRLRKNHLLQLTDILQTLNSGEGVPDSDGDDDNDDASCDDNTSYCLSDEDSISIDSESDCGLSWDKESLLDIDADGDQITEQVFDDFLDIEFGADANER